MLGRLFLVAILGLFSAAMVGRSQEGDGDGMGEWVNEPPVITSFGMGVIGEDIYVFGQVEDDHDSDGILVVIQGPAGSFITTANSFGTFEVRADWQNGGRFAKGTFSAEAIDLDGAVSDEVFVGRR